MPRKSQIKTGPTVSEAAGVATARGGKGKVVISYNSLDELDGILAHIN